MPDTSLLSSLKSAGVRAVILVLLLQAVAFYAFSRTEYIPQTAPLAAFPVAIDQWQTVEEHPIEQEVRDLLQADDLLNRSYVGATGRPANLFIAAFKSQRNGKTPHSPKNCLPGSGWVQLVNDRVVVDLPGVGPAKVNHYIVARGDSRSVVLYWYQSRDRVIASEYAAKFYTMMDSLSSNRSDTALVRIVVPTAPGDETRADQAAFAFAKAVFPSVRAALPR